MPITAAFIDDCRNAFGAEIVDEQIRLGMRGAQTFYARENGIEVGTTAPDFSAPRGITLDKCVLRKKITLKK